MPVGLGTKLMEDNQENSKLLIQPQIIEEGGNKKSSIKKSSTRRCRKNMSTKEQREAGLTLWSKKMI